MKGSVYTALGDSLSAGYGLSDPTTQAWPKILGSERGFVSDNLAISGATTHTMLAQQIPMVSPTTAIITILIGSNDENAIAFGQDTQASAESAYTSALAEISVIAPLAHVVLVTPPDSARFAAGFGAISGRTFTSQEVSAAHASFVAFGTYIRSRGLPVCDLGNDESYYMPGNFGPDTVHPNTTGSIVVANIVEECFQSSGI